MGNGVRDVSILNQSTKFAALCAVMFVAACAIYPGSQRPATTAPISQPQARAPSTRVPTSFGCANSNDMRAVKAAAIKQRLMVASYTCKATDSYRKFVAAYRSELQASDKALQDFFYRLDREGGDRALDTYKTRLANSAMLDNLADAKRYCAGAQQTFSVAMSMPSRELDLFLLTQDVPLTEKVSPCNIIASR